MLVLLSSVEYSAVKVDGCVPKESLMLMDPNAGWKLKDDTGSRETVASATTDNTMLVMVVKVVF